MRQMDDIERSIERLRFTTAAAVDARVLGDAFTALEESLGIGRPVSVWRLIAGSRIVRFAAVAVVIAGILIAVETFREREKPVVAPAWEQVVAERELVIDMFVASDVDGLVIMLSEGQFESKVLAAICLEEIGDERALPELQRLYLLAEEKLPEGYRENPFREPIEKIKKRIETQPDESRAAADANDIARADANDGGAEIVIEEAGVDVNEEAQVDVNKVVKIGVPAGTKGVLDFLVVHKRTAKPLEGVELDIRVEREGPDGERRLVTDKQGRCRIEIVDLETGYVRITVRKERFVPMEVWFRKDEGEVRIDIPTSYTLGLEPGTAIGGFVENEEGEPIERAAVYLAVYVDEPDAAERVYIRDHKVGTDANGFWLCDIIPAELDEIRFRLTHPDYVDDEMYGRTAKPSIEQLRAMTAVMIMERGVPVVGRVVNLTGQPIGKAKVMQGSSRYAHYPGTVTDAQGNFEFSHCRVGEMVVTVQAAGYAPELKEIAVRDGIGPVEIELGPARTIRGRAVDSDGNPIVGVQVTADTWRQHRSIEWRTETDSAGYFVWTAAPADEVLFDFYKQGYMSIESTALSSRVDEYVIVMYPPLQVSGTVVDAGSNEPIRSFRLIPGTKWKGSDQVYWERDRPVKFADGRFEHTFTYPRDGYAVRIEADGYEPAVSRVFYDYEGDVVLDFRLEKGEGPSGTIYVPDGAPAAGAEVILCTPSRGVYIRNGKNVQGAESEFVETGADGRFSFPPQTGKYLLIVVHDEGYAEVTDEVFAAEPNIVIEPWGRVEGVLRIGGQPGSSERIRFNDERPYEKDSPQAYHDCSVVTDANGYFVFDRVPPGEGRVAREIRLTRDRTTYSHAVPVEVKAGETVSITIGGTGRPVVGRVVAPLDYDEPIVWSRVHSSLSTKQPLPPYPDNYQKMTMKEQMAWYLNWQNTEEGEAFINEYLWPEYPDSITEMSVEEIQAWLKGWQESEEGKAHREAQMKRARQQRYYAVRIEPDGTFLVEDVPAGKYQLYVHLYDRSRSGLSGREEVIASLNYEFEVPDINDGRDDEPLDIGTLELEVRNVLIVGDIAPPLEAETFDGGKIRLTDYNGKAVLLLFLVSHDPSIGGKLLQMEEIHETFGRHDQFIMVGVWLDDDIEAARKFVEDNELQWINCFPTGEARVAVYDGYGGQTFPSTFLIGADGKILAKDPSLGQLESALGTERR